MEENNYLNREFIVARLLQQVTFYKNRLKNLLSDAEFGEIEIDQEGLTKLYQLEECCRKLLDYLGGLNSQKHVKLPCEYEIIYNELKQTIDNVEEDM